MRQDLYTEMYHQEEYYWWHLSKRALVKQFLPPPPLKILDIGCGTGKLIEELLTYGEIWGIDKSSNAIKHCRKRHLQHIYQENLPRLRHRYPSFDVITCLDVLEHIENDLQALKTIYHLLKPGGYLILTVPAYPWLFSYWDSILGHYRRYSHKKLEKILLQSGFRLRKFSYLYSFLLPIILPFRLMRHFIFKNHTPQSDFVKLPHIFHLILTIISKTEQSLLRYTNLPFGLSLVCIAEKPKTPNYH